MPSIRLTRHPEVYSDIAEIHAYIAKSDPGAAAAFLGALKLVFDDLIRFPEIGVLYPARHRDGSVVRVRAVKRFRKFLVFYRYDGEEIRVLYVTHSARDLDGVLKRDRR